MALTPRRRLALHALTGLLGVGLLMPGHVLASAAPAVEPGPAVALAPLTSAPGPAPAAPYLIGGTYADSDDDYRLVDEVLVDGARRIQLHGSDAAYLGRRGADPVLLLSGRLVRIQPDGSPIVLARVRGSAVVSADGTRAAISDEYRKQDKTMQVRLVDTSSGRVRARTMTRNVQRIVSVTRRQVLMSTYAYRNRRERESTLSWEPQRGRVRELVREGAVGAAPGADRFVTQTGQPNGGGCTTLRSIRKPQARIWRSCGEYLDSIGVDGSFVTRTINDRAGDEGAQPRVWTRTGAPLAVIATSFVIELFGPSDDGVATAWESPGVLLVADSTSSGPGTSRTDVHRCVVTGSPRCTLAGGPVSSS